MANRSGIFINSIGTMNGGFVNMDDEVLRVSGVRGSTLQIGGEKYVLATDEVEVRFNGEVVRTREAVQITCDRTCKKITVGGSHGSCNITMTGAASLEVMGAHNDVKLTTPKVEKMSVNGAHNDVHL